MSYQIIPNEQPRAVIEASVEGLRYKGRGVFRKKPLETVSFIKPLLWPVRYFEISFSPRTSKSSSDKLRAVRNFMLGNFSLPYIKNILQNDGGRKALSQIFSRENPTILQSLTLLKSPPPVLSFRDPSAIYHQLFKYYADFRSDLDLTLKQSIKDMKPVYSEADSFHRKANTLGKRLSTFSGNKRSTNYRSLRSSQSDFKRKARQLRKKADSAIATNERVLEVFTRKWFRGQRRFLGLRKDSEINNFGIIDTFYYMYWVARLDSSSSVRYLVIDKNGQQVRKIQNMLNFDAKLRNELDSALNFKTFSSDVSCFFCGAPLDKGADFCHACTKDVLKCAVCKLLISHGDPIATCPKCDSKGHLSHLHEWIKTQGKCPTCLQEIKLRNLIVSADNLLTD
ncbi:MAG: hypothetical protein ACTSQB_03995 [Candidatus Heimdallarchaeota archaeon]